MTESIEEQFLNHIASQLNFRLLDAASYIDHCIKETSVKFNVDYNVIYNSIFTKECLSNFLHTSPVKVCSEETLAECVKRCDCFVLEPYGCLSRTIPNSKEINEDPDKYIKVHLGKTPELQRLVEIASYLYYNYDGGGLSDNAFDALEYHLKKRLNLKGRAYEKIGAPPVEKIRTKLKYEMASLSKIKPGESKCTNFLIENPHIVWMSKLDGVSGQAEYLDGKLIALNTRGNGIIGGNVLYLKDYVKNLPQNIDTKGTFVVRGEFIISKELWDKKYKGTFSNARAFVSGKINSGYISPALYDVEFIAYGIVATDTDRVFQPSKALKMLDLYNFVVVDNGLFENPTTFDVIDTYKKKREESRFFIDGLVLSIDEERDSLKPHQPQVNPTDTFAFKMLLEEQIRKTKAINVEWNITRYGRYFPVVIYEAVYIDGSRLTRATGHNAKHITDWHMGSGTKITVVRSGDVIPQIKDVEVNDAIIPILPSEYEWHWEKSDIVLNVIEGNRDVLIKRGVHFFETLGVPKLREKTLEKMYEFGLKTPEDIVNAEITTFIKIKGIGKKTAEYFYNTIKDTIRKTPPDRFIEATSVFKSGIGRKLLKQLFRYIPNLLDLSEEDILGSFKKTKIPGFGQARIKTIAIGIPKFRSYLDSFAKDDVKLAIQNYTQKIKDLDVSGRNLKIDGKKFVLTGFMGTTNYALEDYIYENRGDFVSVVTKDIEAVICGNIQNITKKMTSAYEFGKPVLSLHEFAVRFSLPNSFLKEQKEDTKDEL